VFVLFIIINSEMRFVGYLYIMGRRWNIFKKSSCLHRASKIIKQFYYPTNAQYIIFRYNQNYKIFKSAPTCFGSQRIHHQGAMHNISYVETIKIIKYLKVPQHVSDHRGSIIREQCTIYNM